MVYRLQMGRAVAVVAATLLAASLGGCGVRGSLEKPESAKAATTATADSGQGKAEGEGAKPHKDFILDGLIR